MKLMPVPQCHYIANVMRFGLYFLARCGLRVCQACVAVCFISVRAQLCGRRSVAKSLSVFHR
jgi:hypothetical protein